MSNEPSQGPPPQPIAGAAQVVAGACFFAFWGMLLYGWLTI